MDSLSIGNAIHKDEHDCDEMPFDVAIENKIIAQGDQFYALIDLEGNDSSFMIKYCPWCGQELGAVGT